MCHWKKWWGKQKCHKSITNVYLVYFGLNHTSSRHTVGLCIWVFEGSHCHIAVRKSVILRDYNSRQSRESRSKVCSVKWRCTSSLVVLPVERSQGNGGNLSNCILHHVIGLCCVLSKGKPHFSSKIHILRASQCGSLLHLCVWTALFSPDLEWRRSKENQMN